MDPMIVALATTAATTLVQAMAGDLWREARDKFASLFSYQSAKVANELESLREDVRQDPSLAQPVEDEWRARLVRHLHKNPQSVEALRKVLAEVSPTPAGDTNVHQTMGNVSGTGVQANLLTGGVHTYHGGHHQYGVPSNQINAQSEAELVQIEVNFNGETFFLRVTNHGSRPVRNVELTKFSRVEAKPDESWRLSSTNIRVYKNWEILHPGVSQSTAIQLLNARGRPIQIKESLIAVNYVVRFRDYEGQWWDRLSDGSVRKIKAPSTS